MRGLHVVKQREFARRKVAKATAYKWFCKRVDLLNRRDERMLEKRKAKMPTPTEKKTMELRRKIDSAQRNKTKLFTVIVQSRRRISRDEELILKWDRKIARWTKELNQLSGCNKRVQSVAQKLIP
jgi:hypothetical protein